MLFKYLIIHDNNLQKYIKNKKLLYLLDKK